jgi:hypothetical protein
VRVTEVLSGDKNSGWTGKGELVMNFLKIGSSPVVEIPLAVEFEGINLNQCYQLIAGPKVKTAFDPNWSNVVDVDELLHNALTDISDILSSYSPSDNAKLTGLTTILSSNISDVLNNPNLNQEQKDIKLSMLMYL